MKQKMIVGALAALPLIAMADVSIYGTLKGSVEHNSLSGQASQNDVQDNTSVIGFKGSEEMGNGVKGIWQVESRVHLDGKSNGDTLGSRQTFVGLDGGKLGQVRIGNLNNAFEGRYAVDQWQYDGEINDRGPNGFGPTYSTISGATGLAVFTNSGDRLKNAIRYDSASFDGFSGSLMYSFGENSSKAMGGEPAESASDILGLNLNYAFNDALSAVYAYQRENKPAREWLGRPPINPAASKSLFEVDYHANRLFLSAAYQIATGYDWVDDFSGSGRSTYHGGTMGNSGIGATPAVARLKTQQMALSAAYHFGAFTPKVSYAKGWNQQAKGHTIADSGYRQYIAGVDYALSKRTTAGVSYGNLRFDKNTAVAQDVNRGSRATLKATSVTLAHSF